MCCARTIELITESFQQSLERLERSSQRTKGCVYSTLCSLHSHITRRHRAKARAILLAGGGVRPLGGRGVRKTEGNTQGAVRTHSIRITQANT